MASLVCPKCAVTVESATGEATPTRCTTCGARLTCPSCGAPLSASLSAGAGDEMLCLQCGAQAGGTETVADRAARGTPPRSSLLLPGFEILREIGRGGMGIVYAAIQLQLQRQVALKVLPPIMAADPVHMERFHQEARIAARLANAHVLPIIDIKDAQGVPVLVLPLINGTTLGRIVRDRQAVREGQAPAQVHAWARLDERTYLGKMLPLLDQVVDAVTAIHQEHVLHRDIKPSNVLVDEHEQPWLSDFGLARLERAGLGTAPGLAVGTRGYMSPEQARGEAIDARSDLFALGVTIYQALTLRLPYSKEGMTGPPEPPSRLQALLARDFDAVVLKALAAERDQRYGSAVEFRDDWRSVRQGLLPKAVGAGPVRRLARRVRRHPWTVASAVALIILAGVLTVLLVQGPPEGPGEPPDPTPYRAVSLSSSPVGARVVLVPLSPDTGEPLPGKAIRPAQRTPLRLERVPAGRYLVVAELDGAFHEVYRLVPGPADRLQGLHRMERWEEAPDGTVELREIRIPAKDVAGSMAFFAGGEFTMGTASINGVPPHRRQVPAFYLDATEVTVGAYREKLKVLPDPLAHRQPPDDHAVSYVTFNDALACAELLGKRLPNEVEYEFAATNRGELPFPWGDKRGPLEADWLLGPVKKPDFDRTAFKPHVYGLYSNVAEWTTSWLNPYPGSGGLGKDLLAATRVVRGGPWPIINGEPDRHDARFRGPRHREGVFLDRRCPGLGFRCARSAEPRFLEK